tara:strand:- start:293 stop:1078 length:786 start_codon:yes stop_codon:yes gene_type:complete
MKFHCLALALGMTIWGLSNSSIAAPGFRDQNTVPEEATFTLGKPGRFGPTVIPGTILKAIYRGDALHFSDPRTMQPLGKVPCRQAKLRKWHPKASIQTLRKARGKKIRLYLTYRYGKSECTATGWIDPNARMRKEVVLKQGPRVRPQVEGIPKEKTEAELLFRGLNRYISSVVHCATKAEKYRWKTGESKLNKCTCPIVESWRLPRVKEPVRVSIKIQNFKMGVSLTVNSKGRVESCSPWVARVAPQGEPKLLEKLLQEMK